MALGSRTTPDSFTETDFFADYVLTAEQNADCKTPNTADMISMPNSNAFIDLNGDCVPDLLLTRQSAMPASGANVSTYYEIYSQIFVDGASKYCLSTQNGQLVDPTDIRTT